MKWGREIRTICYVVAASSELRWGDTDEQKRGQAGGRLSLLTNVELNSGAASAGLASPDSPLDPCSKPAKPKWSCLCLANARREHPR